METPVSAWKAEQPECEENQDGSVQSFPTTLDAGGFCLASDSESGAVLDTGNLARFRWLEHHYRIVEQTGNRKVSTYPPPAQVPFGDGRLGVERHAAGAPAGIARSRGRVYCVCAGCGRSRVIA